MKYIPAEKLIAEIERLKDGIGIGLCEYDAGEENGKMEILIKLSSLITSLRQEQLPLPANLDEAAEEYERNLGYYECINQWPSVAFKAGAEWMDKKIAEESYEEEVQELYQDEGGIHCVVSVGTDYKPGEHILVYTRKEE